MNIKILTDFGLVCFVWPISYRRPITTQVCTVLKHGLLSWHWYCYEITACDSNRHRMGINNTYEPPITEVQGFFPGWPPHPLADLQTIKIVQTGWLLKPSNNLQTLRFFSSLNLCSLPFEAFSGGDVSSSSWPFFFEAVVAEAEAALVGWAQSKKNFLIDEIAKNACLLHTIISNRALAINYTSKLTGEMWISLATETTERRMKEIKKGPTVYYNMKTQHSINITMNNLAKSAVAPVQRSLMQDSQELEITRKISKNSNLLLY